MIEYYYNMVTHGTGNLYLQAEQNLLQQGEKAIDFLQQAAQKETTPIPLLTNKVLIKRIKREPVYEAVLDFFRQTEEETADTAIGEPIPEWVADKLYLDFGASVADLLGLYLVKLESIWPYWKTVGITLYLGQLNSRDAADPLIEFILSTSSNQYQKFATESLIAISDSFVLKKIQARIAFFDQPREKLLEAEKQVDEALQIQASKKVET